MASHYADYYVSQAQTGHGMSFYAGLPTQKGYGIGSLLGGLFRTVLPFLKMGAKTVGREALRAGSHVLADVAAGAAADQSLKRHASEAGQNLLNMAADKMKGNGIKRGRGSRQRQSTRGARTQHISHFDILGK